MDIQTQMMRRAVHHPTPVIPSVVGEGFLDRAGQHTDLRQELGDHPDGSTVRVQEAVARPAGRDTGLLGGQDRLVDTALRVGVVAIDRQRTGHIRRIQRIDLDPGVQQQQVAVQDVAVVADPVESIGVITARGDGVVADVVSQVARVQTEDSLHPAFTTTACHGVRKLTGHRLETHPGGIAGTAQFIDLEIVLDQAQLGERAEQLGVCFLGLAATQLVDHGGDLRIALAHHTQPGDPGKVIPQLAQIPAGETDSGSHLLQRVALTYPHLSVTAGGVELLIRPGAAWTEVQADSVRGDHGDRVRFPILTQPRHPGEGGVGTEPIVTVVGAHLVRPGRDHEGCAREGLTQGGPACGSPVGGCQSLGRCL